MKKLSIISLVVSIIAICIAIFRIEPFVVSEETYIGLIATLIGVSVTMLIGYQIYNVVEYKQELKKQVTEINELKKKTDELFETIVKKDYEVQEGFDVIQAFICYLDNGRINSIGAFISLHSALLSALNANRKDYSTIFMLMRRFIKDIDSTNFAIGMLHKDGQYYSNDQNSEYYNLKMSDVVNKVTQKLTEDREAIMNHDNYPMICMEYERVMSHYDTRIKNILDEPMKMISDDEYLAIMNPS